MHGRGLNRFHVVSRFMANTPAAAKKSMSIVRRTKSSAGTDLAAAHAEMFTVLVSRVIMTFCFLLRPNEGAGAAGRAARTPREPNH